MSDSESERGKSKFTCIWNCGICVSVCPEEAISHGSEVFFLENRLCSRCLLCLKACPAAIIVEDLIG